MNRHRVWLALAVLCFACEVPELRERDGGATAGGSVVGRDGGGGESGGGVAGGGLVGGGDVGGGGVGGGDVGGGGVGGGDVGGGDVGGGAAGGGAAGGRSSGGTAGGRTAGGTAGGRSGGTPGGGVAGGRSSGGGGAAGGATGGGPVAGGSVGGGSGGGSSTGGGSGSFGGGDVFFISPTGNNGNNCSRVSRCATINGVLAKPSFGAGDVIVVGDGNYVNPAVFLNCQQTPKLNGTPSGRITIRAENERQAHLVSNDGRPVFRQYYCNYWSFEGLRMSQEDFATAGGNVVQLYHATDIQFRRNLISRNNRLNTSSAGGVLFLDIDRAIVEENEFYDYRRHAFSMKYVHTGGVFRRNYCNQRTRTTADGTCLTIYPGSNIVVEDNIVENSPVYAFDSMPFSHDNVNNRWLGNIGVNCKGVILPKSRCDGGPHATLGAIVNDTLAVGGGGLALWSRSSQVVATHNSAFGGNTAGFLADQETCAPVPNSFIVRSSLAVGKTSAQAAFFGTSDVVRDTFQLQNVAAFGNSTNFSPVSHPGIMGVLTSDPQLGSARVCIPVSSPLHGAAPDGSDIGANVLYRYENGIKTTSKRWVTTKPASCPANVSGIYPYNLRPCVPGVNDDVSKSQVGVADRLGMSISQVEVTCGAGAGYFP